MEVDGLKELTIAVLVDEGSEEMEHRLQLERRSSGSQRPLENVGQE